MSNWPILLCAFILGFITFIQRLSADRMDPIVMQIVVGLAFIVYIPLAVHMQGGLSNIKWSMFSIAITLIATFLVIFNNIIFYSFIRSGNNTGSTTMLLCLYPVVTLLFSVIFLHETLSLSKIIGIISMIIGTIFLSLG